MTVAAWVHARTGERMLAKLDAHSNLLRGSTAAMAAVCGGADSLHVAPWDSLLPAPGVAGRRLSRNLQLILGHECRFGAVTDPAGGSWYVETLTREVGEGAWAVLQKVEAAGGLRAALASGLVHGLVDEAAKRRAARLARAQDSRVGVNRFCAARAAVEAGGSDRACDDWRAERRDAAEIASAGVGPVDPRGDAAVQFADAGRCCGPRCHPVAVDDGARWRCVGSCSGPMGVAGCASRCPAVRDNWSPARRAWPRANRGWPARIAFAWATPAAPARASTSRAATWLSAASR